MKLMEMLFENILSKVNNYILGQPIRSFLLCFTIVVQGMLIGQHGHVDKHGLYMDLLLLIVILDINHF